MNVEFFLQDCVIISIDFLFYSTRLKTLTSHICLIFALYLFSNKCSSNLNQQ